MRLFYYFLGVFSFVESLPAEEFSLELVHVFFRHGCRTPEAEHRYPTDPYTDKHFDGVGWGQLTNAGKERAFQLGQHLRNRYNTFLGDAFYPELIYAQSTDFDRTKMSMLLLLAGLFPPIGRQQWNINLLWLPIPFSYEKAKNDFFLRRPTHYCPAYVKEVENVLANESKVIEILEKNLSLFKYLEKHSGLPMSKLSDIFNLYQTLNAEETLKLNLPQWTQSVYPEKIHHLAGWQCAFENWTPLLKKLNGGRSLSKVVHNMKKKMSEAFDPIKIYLYAGHENNVVNILSALEMFEPHVPKYSAAVIIELYVKQENGFQKQYYVKIFYVRDIDRAPVFEEQKLQDCDSFCAWHKFMHITRDIIPHNYTLECESSVFID